MALAESVRSSSILASAVGSSKEGHGEGGEAHWMLFLGRLPLVGKVVFGNPQGCHVLETQALDCAYLLFFPPSTEVQA